MTILAIDTSTDYLSLALLRNGKIIARFHRKLSMRHSSMLVPTIERLLKASRVKLSAVDCLAISVGPGSFTGLRIGVTTVKGLSYALGIPIVAVPTLDAIARNVKNFRGIICPVLDARKNKAYASFYDSAGKKIRRISKYLLLTAKDLMESSARYDKIFFLGDGLHIIERTVNAKFDWHPRADVVAHIGAELFADKRIVSAEDLEPMYLYSRECDIKGK